jgi:hypothetical protein
MSEAGLIRTLQQARPQHGVDMHRGRHNRTGNLIDPNWLKKGSSRCHNNCISQIGRVFRETP